MGLACLLPVSSWPRRDVTDSMYTKQVWTLVDVPNDIVPTGSKWVFMVKIEMDDNIQI